MCALRRAGKSAALPNFRFLEHRRCEDRKAWLGVRLRRTEAQDYVLLDDGALKARPKRRGGADRNDASQALSAQAALFD
jgi:hypothetical protein